jgi:hypothetical protein
MGLRDGILVSCGPLFKTRNHSGTNHLDPAYLVATGSEHLPICSLELELLVPFAEAQLFSRQAG